MNLGNIEIIKWNFYEKSACIHTITMTYLNAPHQYNQQAYARGEDAAKAAASWVIDGNTSREHIKRMVKWFDDGDPQLDQYLPSYPNLSGEWSNGLTPAKLYEEITGTELLPNSNNIVGMLAECAEISEAFNEGVADHFRPECERILRAAVE